MEQRATYLSEMHSQLRTVNLELESLETEIERLLSRQQELLDRKALIEEQIQEEEIEPAASNSGNQLQNQHSIDWSSTSFSWTQKVDDALQHVFHIQGFRKLQRETVNATLSGMDCLLIMPTGGGKSLCYQLPAIVSDGFTLVVSPLISLMEDQILALHDLDVKAALLNSNSTREHVNNVQSEMVNRQGRTKLIYVTPEKIAKSKRFMTKLEKAYEAGLLARIVIDEVHCTSQWGHDFRPDYKYLNILKRQFPKTAILGLTATATSKVLIDIKKILNLQKGCLVFRASFNRPNLFYEVIMGSSSQSSAIDDISKIINTRFKGQSGIVYCFSRKDSETVTVELQKRGIKAGCYHADIPQESRSQVHYSWLKNKIQVVVATVAFGMGIDKPDVRFVIHHSISKSMENFYQESGRAGRDDNVSSCILFFKFADAFRQSTMVFTEQTGLSNLYGMLEYCLDMRSCRRQLIGKHFEERWDPAECNAMCDNCRRMKSNSAAINQDVTKCALDILKLVKHAANLKERITALKLVEAWFGKGAANLRVASVYKPSFTRLLIQEVLTEEIHFTPYKTLSYLVAGPRAGLVTSQQLKIFIHIQNSKDSLENGPSSKDKPSSASLSNGECATRSSTSVSPNVTPKTAKRKKPSTSTDSKPKATSVSKQYTPSGSNRKLKLLTVDKMKIKRKKICIDDSDNGLSDDEIVNCIADELTNEYSTQAMAHRDTQISPGQQRGQSLDKSLESLEQKKEIASLNVCNASSTPVKDQGASKGDVSHASPKFKFRKTSNVVSTNLSSA